MKQLESLFDKGLVWSAAHASLAEATQSDTGGEHYRDERRERSHRKTALCAQFGVPAIDQVLPLQGLPFGALHEFAFQHALQRRKELGAPLWVLATLLAHSMRSEVVRTESIRTNRHVVVWIGRRCWPTPHALEAVYGSNFWGSDFWGSNLWQDKARRESFAREHFLFLDPPSTQKRLWSIRETLRQRCVFATIADATEFAPQAYRSLQLAAHHGGGLALLVRNSDELKRPSAAYSRWLLSPHRAEAAPHAASHSERGTFAAWKIDLLKIRGSVGTGTELPLRWHIALTLLGEEGRNDASALSLFPEPTVSLSREKRTYSAA